MRVLFVTGEFPPMQGGVGDCTKEIALALAADGVEVSVVTSTKAAGQAWDAQAPLHPLAFTFQPTVKSWDWSALPLIAKCMRECQADVVHLQFQTGAFSMHPSIYFLPYFLSHGVRGLGVRHGPPRRRARAKVCVTFHDLRVPYLFPKAGSLRDRITHYLARSCDGVIATNDEDYSQLSALRLKVLRLIPIGSNISTVPPVGFSRGAWRAKLGVGDNETLLCYFGFLNRSKGGETLIRALALVPNVKLLMIGGQVGASDPTNAVYLMRVKSLIAELGLAERVLWTDHIPQEVVTANLLASDICVMPYSDGASFRRGTLMAALAHGCAIITTTPAYQSPDASRALPQLNDGENCLLVAPSDPPALAAAIQRAMISPQLCAQIGEGARELARLFTWDTIAQQYSSLYRQILA